MNVSVSVSLRMWVWLDGGASIVRGVCELGESLNTGKF